MIGIEWRKGLRKRGNRGKRPSDVRRRRMAARADIAGAAGASAPPVSSLPGAAASLPAVGSRAGILRTSVEARWSSHRSRRQGAPSGVAPAGSDPNPLRWRGSGQGQGPIRKDKGGTRRKETRRGQKGCKGSRDG